MSSQQRCANPECSVPEDERPIKPCRVLVNVKDGEDLHGWSGCPCTRFVPAEPEAEEGKTDYAGKNVRYTGGQAVDFTKNETLNKPFGEPEARPSGECEHEILRVWNGTYYQGVKRRFFTAVCADEDCGKVFELLPADVVEAIREASDELCFNPDATEAASKASYILADRVLALLPKEEAKDVDTDPLRDDRLEAWAEMEAHGPGWKLAKALAGQVRRQRSRLAAVEALADELENYMGAVTDVYRPGMRRAGKMLRETLAGEKSTGD